MIETNLSRIVSALLGRRDMGSVTGVRSEPLFVLGLSAFYAVFGVRSDRLSESVMLVCETVMKERLGADDALVALESEAMLFRLADMNAPATVERAVDMVARIAVKLLGEHFVQSGNFHVLLAAVDGAGVIGADGRLRHRGIDALRAHGRAHAVPSAHPAVRFVDVRGSTAWIPEPAEKHPGWEIVGGPSAPADPARQWSDIASSEMPPAAGWERLADGSRRERRLAMEATRGASGDSKPQRRTDGTGEVNSSTRR